MSSKSDGRPGKPACLFKSSQIAYAISAKILARQTIGNVQNFVPSTKYTDMLLVSIDYPGQTAFNSLHTG